jgi:hypothetical protein
MPAIAYKPLGDFLRMLKAKEAFSFSRYWDGELACVVGRDGMNCDGCHYTPELKEALRKTLSNNLPYYHALYFPEHHNGTVNLRAQFEQYLKSTDCRINWYDAMIWQRAVEEGTFHDVTTVLSGRNVVFAGGPHLASVQTSSPHWWKFYELPAVDAHLKHELILSELLNLIRSIENPVLVLCAGMESNCLIDDLFPSVGKQCTMLDMGSVWDYKLNLKTRQWIRRILP